MLFLSVDEENVAAAAAALAESARK